MTEKSYKKIEVFFKAHDKLYFLLRIIYKYLPLLIYMLYPVLLVNTFIHMMVNGEKDDFIKTLVIPAVTFLSVTLLRKVINRPRPYEALDINGASCNRSYYGDIACFSGRTLHQRRRSGSVIRYSSVFNRIIHLNCLKIRQFSFCIFL